MVRGPGITPGTRLDILGSNIDIAPTMIDIAGSFRGGRLWDDLCSTGF